MKALKLASVVLAIIGLSLTGLGGMMDMIEHDFQITKKHAWYDGLFLILLSIWILVYLDD